MDHPRFQKNSLRVLWLFLASVVYLLLFIILYPLNSTIALCLSTLPLVIAARYFGFAQVLSLGILSLLLHTFSLPDPLASVMGITMITALLASLGKSWISNGKLQAELDRLKAGQTLPGAATLSGKPPEAEKPDRRLEQFRDRLKRLHVVGLKLALSQSLDEFFRKAIELARSELEFDRVGIWLADPEPDFMLGTFGTSESGELRDERGRRFIFLRAGFFSRNSLDAVVWENVDLYNEKHEVIGQGWSAAATLWDGNKVIGWISIDNLIKQEAFSQESLDVLRLYGMTLGYLCSYKRIEQGHKDFQDQLQRLHAVSLQLTHCESLDALCRLAVELGRRELSFDRMSIWLADDDPNFVLGTFGTSETGELRDERGIRMPVLKEHIPSQNSMNAIVRENADLYNDKGEVIGKGWIAVAILWDGDKVLGWVSVDNLLRGESFSQARLDLLKLYGMTLGHLCKRKHVEQSLRESERSLRQLADGAFEGIVIHKQGQILEANQAFCQLFGYSRSELQNQSLLDFIVPDFRDTVREKMGGDELSACEVQALHKDGTSFPVELLSQRTSYQGRAGHIATIRDLSARELVESQRLELALARQKDTLLREFLNTVSHDLKTPLSIINTSLYLMERDRDSDHQKPRLELIKAQSGRLAKLIQDIITISRLDSLPEMPSELLDLNQLIEAVYQQFTAEAEKQKLLVILDLDETLPAVLANKEEINRVLVNLLENAMHYTAPEGKITIRSFAQANQLVLEVRDTGIGIEESDLPHIFEHFYRADKARSTDKGGTGLGLAIVRKIVEMHNGTIEVMSRSGEGSTFRVQLPKTS